MAQVLEGALNASIAPRAVLRRHSQDQRAHFLRRGRSARRPLGAAIVFPGNWTLMPIQQRARGDDSGEHFEPLQTDLPGLGGQPSALVVVEAGLLTQLFLQDSNFLLEIFDDALLVAVE